MKHKAEIEELKVQTAEVYQQLLEKTKFAEEQVKTVELLDSKLRDTSSTLLSNNSTIESLKQSLAEA
jgi:hypothetical protein